MRSSARTLITRASLAVALTAPLGVLVVPTAEAVTNSSLKKEVLVRVNAERAKVGCKPLRRSSALSTAAQGHSTDMRRRDYFSHTSKDGRSPWDRIRATGYRYGSAENIAAGQRTAKAVVAAWMKSPGHRKNILDCSNKAVGTGVSRGRSTYYVYWTQDFGRR